MKTNIKKQLIIFFISILNLPLSAQTAHSVRNIARDASLEIDAVYTNPAGLVKLKDGFHFSFSNQASFQTRAITSTFIPFTGYGENETKRFKETVSALIIPSLQAAYKKDKWTLSSGIALRGGKATFNNGISMFEAPIAAIPPAIEQFAESLKLPLTCDQYTYDTYMTRTNYIFGGQIGGTYKINDLFSVYAGFRLNIAYTKYEGYIRDIEINPNSQVSGLGNGKMVNASEYFTQLSSNPMLSEEQQNVFKAYATSTVDKKLSSRQSGCGIAPIFGLNFNYKEFNIGVKYESRAALDMENKTKVDDIGMFNNGAKTSDDIPALFSIGLSYQLSPKLLASVGYHHIFESDARKPNNKQQYINNTNEFQAGLEYKIDNRLLLSIGGQYCIPKVEDNYQTDLDYILKSYTVGLGAAYDFTDKLILNIGYQWRDYTDYTKLTDNFSSAGLIKTDRFSESKLVFAIGFDYHF